MVKNEVALFLRKVTRMLMGNGGNFSSREIIIRIRRFEETRAARAGPGAGEKFCARHARKIYLYETVAALTPARDSRGISLPRRARSF